MNGIQVLNTYTVASFNIFIGIVVLILCATIIVIGSICIKDRDMVFGIPVVFIGVVFAVIILFLIAHNDSETHYDVLIDDSVSFNSIYSHYIIDGKDGEIYHLTLRDSIKDVNSRDQ